MQLLSEICCSIRHHSDNSSIEAPTDAEESYMEGGHSIANMIIKAERVAACTLNATEEFNRIERSYNRYYVVHQIGRDNATYSRPIISGWSLPLQTQRALLEDLDSVAEQWEDLDKRAQIIMDEFSYDDFVNHHTSPVALKSEIQKLLDLMEKNHRDLLGLKKKIDRLQRDLDLSISFYRVWCSIL